jgi:ABC-2 type transport system permease protein
MKYWRETFAVAQRILIELGRRRRSLVFWSIFPISVLLLNGLILAERAKLSTAKAFESAAPSTLVGAALFFSCLGGSVGNSSCRARTADSQAPIYSPLSGTSYFLGIFFAHSCIGIGQTLLVYTISAFLGARFQGSVCWEY